MDDIQVTGGLEYNEDFEGTLGAHVQFANTNPSAPFGQWARIYEHITDNDACTENTTCAWLFTDLSGPPTTRTWHLDRAAT